MTAFDPRRFFFQGMVSLAMIGLIIIFLTLMSITNGWDLQVSGLFFSETEGWAFREKQPWDWLYDYGFWPGIIYLLVCTSFYFLSFYKPRYRPWRRYLLVVMASGYLGTGLFINSVLKDYTGRPRPRQTVNFGERWEFKNPGELGVPGKGKSFPCGHCAIAYVFVSSAVFFRRAPRLAVVGVFVGIGYGILMSLARIGQGGHFLTDSLWALSINLAFSVFFYFFVFKPSKIDSEQFPAPTHSQILKRSLLTLGVMGLFLWILLGRRPFFKDHDHGMTIGKEIKKMEIVTNIAQDDIEIHYFDPMTSSETHPRIHAEAHAFGSLKVKYDLDIVRESKDDTYFLKYLFTTDDYIAQEDLDLDIYVPEHLRNAITILSQEP